MALTDLVKPAVPTPGLTLTLPGCTGAGQSMKLVFDTAAPGKPPSDQDADACTSNKPGDSDPGPRLALTLHSSL